MNRFADVDDVAKEFGGVRTTSAYSPGKEPNPGVRCWHFPTYDDAGKFADRMKGSSWIVIGGHEEIFPHVPTAIGWLRASPSSKYKRMMLAKFGEGHGGATGVSRYN